MSMTLADYLDQWTGRGNAGAPRAETAAVVRVIAGTASDLAERISLGPLRSGFAEVVGSNTDGDSQAALDRKSVV